MLMYLISILPKYMVLRCPNEKSAVSRPVDEKKKHEFYKSETPPEHDLRLAIRPIVGIGTISKFKLQ